MDIDDTDAQDQNLHIVEEASSKVSPALHSYSLPKFEFDDSLHGQLRFANIADNDGFLETSQEDNHWIEEYSTAVKSTRNNVWSEATSSESVEMLLKSVGQEEKVLEESNKRINVTNVMDPKGTLDSVVLGANYNSSVGEGTLDQEASKIATESFVNGLQESKNDCNNINDPDCIIKSKENSMNKSTDSDTVAETRTYGVEKLALVLDVESVGKPLVEGGVSVNEETENVESAHAESNMDVLTDAVVAVESSKMSSPDTTEDQARSPILGVSLLSDDKNKENVEAGLTSDGTFQKRDPEAEKGKFVHFNAARSEQTGNDESGSLQGAKESMAGDDGAKPLNLAVNMPDQQHSSVDVDNDPSSLDKPQTCSLSDTKTIELSQSAKDKHEVNKDSVHDNPTVSSSGTKEEKNFTFEVNASSSQNPSLSTNMVSSISSQGSQLDPIELHEDSPVSQPPAAAGVKGNSNRKPRKRSVGTETAKQSNKLTDKTPARRSRKIEKSPDMTPISTINLPIPNTSVSVSHHSFTDTQQLQLRAQILVYGSVLSGVPPEESHMIAAFGHSDGGRRTWEPTWHAYLERARCHQAQAQPNTPGSSTPNQGIKILPGISSPIVNPFIPISSPLWNIPTNSDVSAVSQSNAKPKSDLFGPYQTPGAQNFTGPNPMWLPQGPFPGQWVASSPVASFNARFSALPITESVKLTTVKESSGPSIPMIPVGPSIISSTISPTISPMVSSGQTSSDPKSRKRKKVVDHVDQNVDHVDQNIVTRETTVSKVEESKVQAADAAVHAATAVTHCQNVWSQLKSQTNSGLISDDEAKLASSAVSIAAASSVAKVAAAAAKLASNVAEQARLMADEVFLSNKTESYNHSNNINSTSIIAAAKEAARRRIEAASAASKHAENLDAIVKAAELAAEAVSQAGKIVAIGNPLLLKELVEAGPEGYWKSPQGCSDKQNVENALNDNKDSGDLVKGQMIIATSDVEQNMFQSNSGTWKDDSIREGCLVEVRRDDNNRSAWYAANVSTLKEGKAFVSYTELQLDDGSGKLKEWVALEAEGTEPPRIRIAHPMTTMRSEGTRKRGRTTDYAWCNGDRVDVWAQDCWCEAVVMETNKTDLTTLTVQFSAQGETTVVRSWQVRPTLIWKDGKWIEWSSLKGSRSPEADTPQEKRHKLGSPFVEGEKPKSSNATNLVESGRHQESKNNIPLSIIENSSITTTVNSSLQKKQKQKQSRVVFGVPKPGKTQKFMDVSSHRVDDKNKNNNNKTNTPNDSVKLVNYLTPQGSKTNKEKQVAEVKVKVKPEAVKSRKPPVPSVKSLMQKEKVKNSKPGSTSDENLSGQTNKMDVDFSNTEDSKESKGEVEDKASSEMEPRRSVRRIQPTSRLLEGLQSTLTVSHASQRSHKVTSKGSSN